MSLKYFYRLITSIFAGNAEIFYPGWQDKAIFSSVSVTVTLLVEMITNHLTGCWLADWQQSLMDDKN